MNVDPNANVVVFEVMSGGEVIRIVGEGRARDEGCVRAVWAASRDKSGGDGVVLAIYSEWEPSQADRTWIETTFGSTTKLSYSFERPTCDDGWAEALRNVAATIEQTTREQDSGPKKWWRLWK